MSGARWIYIFDELQVYETPHPKDWVFKSVPELADKEVLQVTIYYDTYNRKPYQLITIQFDRVRLDNNGGYRLSDDIVNGKMRNFIHYSFTTAEDLSTREDPWEIPDAPIIPTKEEIIVLKEYIKLKLPRLYNNCAEVIVKQINDTKSIHKRNLDLI